ncbi:larval cuticle protein 1-like [Pollicipes pollicipes]|uniref:larval cuticle protein 1-like n=1 Tax=Pollicipes pollicipes TaxID=41117 RepID=UPI001885798B|nr:larval cuticle protein 1-like [Pollicipes pollicipes]
MKLLVIAALLAVAVARPQEAEYDPTAELREAGIIRMEMSQNEDGSFQYGYETTDPASQDVSGQNKIINSEPGIVMQGTYSFVAKDENGNDVSVTVNWTADENGFQAQGDSIPVAPEDPNAAAQAAAYAAAGGQQE